MPPWVVSGLLSINLMADSFKKVKVPKIVYRANV